MSTVTIDDCGKGINKDLLPAELEPGVWSDASNFRFRNGFAEKWEGFGMSVSGVWNPYWMAIHETSSTSLMVWVASTPAGAVYAYDIPSGLGSGGTAITPYIAPAIISTLNRINATTAEATTATAHGLSTGDTVIVYNAVESGYNTATAASITVMSSTVFRYTVSSIAANATTVGAYVVYSSAASSALISSYWNRFTGGNFNGTLLLNSPVDGMFYWSGDTSVRFRRFGVTNYVSDVARPFKNFIVQLARTIGGTKKIHNVSWSASAEPGALPASFTASDTNDAGDIDLSETAGRLVDCLSMGDVNIVYKEDARYAMQYVGGNDVFKFTRLPGSDGLVARGFVVDTPVGHVYVTADLDVRVHSGGQSRGIANARVKKYLASRISVGVASRDQGFLEINQDKSEVLIFLRTTSATALNGCDVILAWNWIDDTWSLYNISNELDGVVYSATRGVWRVTGGAATSVTIVGRYGHSARSDIYQATVATLERAGLHFGDRDTFKSLQRSRWNVDGTAGQTMTVYHGSSKTADGAVTYTSPSTYTIGTTNYVAARATSGPFVAIKISTSASDPLSIRSIDLDMTGGGKR